MGLTRDVELKDGSPLRRYMDLPKFLNLLQSNSLYFRRSDLFQDKFEGAFTPALIEGINAAQRELGGRMGVLDLSERCRMGTYVNCWTYGAKDNMALWQLYGGTSASVAVNTNVGNLSKVCLESGLKMHIAKVKYIDHFENPDMIISRPSDPLEYKHVAFEYEREVRALLSEGENWKNNPDGKRVGIGDINSLITSVIVSPDAGDWFVELVEDLAKKYGLKCAIRRSQLSALP